MYRLLSRTSRAHTAPRCEGQEPGTGIDPQRPDHLSSLTTEENGREGRTAWCQEHLSERGRWVMNEQRLAKSSETRTGKETEMMQNKNSKYKTENGQEQKKPNSE